MKKGFLNKILYASFKFGKVFAVLALIVLVLTMIGSGVYLLKINNPKIVTPQFEVVKQALENENSSSYSDSSSDYVSTNVIRKEKAEKKYKQIIENIVETAKLKPFAYDMILTNVAKYDSKYQSQYLEGLSSFIPDGLKYIHDKYKVNTNNVSVSKQALSGVIEEYNRMFDAEISRVDSEKMSQIQEKIVAGSTLAISILLFVICLFLPLLIKIEENTRQQLELTLKGNENA